MNNIKETTFNAGEIIFQVGQIADKLYLVKRGNVEILGDNGFSIAKLSDGQSFGEQAFLRGGIRGASAKAIDEVTCIVLTAEEVNGYLSKASSMLIPVFEALLLQQNMNNELRKNRK
jgi:CRP-like cAMP-binding protein